MIVLRVYLVKGEILMKRTRMIVVLLILFMLTGCGRCAQTLLTTAPQINMGIAKEQDSQNAETDSPSVTVTAFDAGAADAIVLISKNNVILIDTGYEKKANKLVKSLKKLGVTRIDELIISHHDNDHIGGADHIIKEFDIGTIYTTYPSMGSEEIAECLQAVAAKGLEPTVVTQEMSFTADGVVYTIYPPQKKTYSRKVSNNSSLAVLVNAGGSTMLFTGDAEKERIEELIQIKDLKCDVLKVPHHGRTDELTKALIDYVKPSYAIITSSNNKPEHQKVKDILSAAGTETYLTREGNVTIILSEGSIEISQLK